MPFYMIVGLSILMLMAILSALKPVRAHLDKKTDRSAFHHLLATVKNRNYRIGFMATAFMSLGGYFMMPWGSAFAVNNVGLSQKELPLLFMVVGVATFMIMPLIGILADKINKFKQCFSSFEHLKFITIYTNYQHISEWFISFANKYVNIVIF